MLYKEGYTTASAGVHTDGMHMVQALAPTCAQRLGERPVAGGGHGTGSQNGGAGSRSTQDRQCRCSMLS